MSTATYTSLVLASLLAAPMRPASAVQETNLDARLEARIARAVDACVGLEVRIDLGGETLLHLASGAGTDGKARRQGDLLRAPALLRPLTSIAVLRLAAAASGESETPFGLDRTVAKYVPAAALGEEPVTVRHLLAGTSGLAPYWPELSREARAGATKEALLAVVAAAGLVAAPGHCFDPNESELLLLGALVEAVTGEPLPAAIGALASAAGLERTGFLAEDEAPARAAGDVTLELDFERLAAPPLFPFGEDRLCTTVPDLARLVRALAGRDLLDEASLEELLAPGRVEPARGAPSSTGFGLGIDLVRLATHDGATVGGGGPGGAMHVVRYPAPDLTIVLAATEPDAPLAELSRDLARLVLGVPAPGVQDLALSEADARRCIGGYLLGCNRIDVTRGEDGHLVLTPVDGRPRVLLHQGGHRFVAADCSECAVEFSFRDGDERASGLVLLEHGLRSEAVRVD